MGPLEGIQFYLDSGELPARLQACKGHVKDAYGCVAVQYTCQGSSGILLATVNSTMRTLGPKIAEVINGIAAAMVTSTAHVGFAREILTDCLIAPADEIEFRLSAGDVTLNTLKDQALIKRLDRSFYSPQPAHGLVILLAELQPARNKNLNVPLPNQNGDGVYLLKVRQDGYQEAADHVAAIGGDYEKADPALLDLQSKAEQRMQQLYGLEGQTGFARAVHIGITGLIQMASESFAENNPGGEKIFQESMGSGKMLEVAVLDTRIGTARGNSKKERLFAPLTPGLLRSEFAPFSQQEIQEAIASYRISDYFG